MCHRLRLSQVLLALVPALIGALAGEATAADVATARMIFNKALPGTDSGLVVQCGYEVTAPGNRWYGVYCQLRLDKDTSLRGPDGKDFLKHWGNIFTPAGKRPWHVPTARWTDSRVLISADELASLQGLPKGRQFTLWASCDVWDPDAKKWLSNGWDVATPVLITTNDAGKVTALQTFNTDPPALAKNHYSEKTKAKVCQLKTAALRFKEGAEMCHTEGLRNEPYNKLILGDQQADLFTTSRGQFFQPIDTPEKAAELVKLAFPQGVVVKNAEQYDAIVKSLRKIEDWNPKQFLLLEKPPFVGFEAAEVPGLGYRVKMLAIYHHTYGALGLRDVSCYEFCIAKDGRMGLTTTACIAAPQTPYGAPPMWKPEFGLPKQTAPAPGPSGGPSVPSFTMEAAVDAHNQAIRSALTREGSEKIEPLFVVTETSKEIPKPADEE